MIASIIINILLALLIVYLLFKAGQRARQIEIMGKQEKRQWLLKTALEQSCQVPTVEAEELAPIEPEIDRLMSNANNDKDVEKKIRKLIMGLYEAKVKGKKG
jgi:thiamine biosynthesis lipoprotein ApbE